MRDAERDHEMDRLMLELEDLAERDPDDPNWLRQSSVTAHVGSRIQHVQQRVREYMLLDDSPRIKPEPATGLSDWLTHNRR